MAKIGGIHLGTINCCTAVMEDGQLLVIANTEGQCMPPSDVAHQKIGDCLVYQIATENGD